MRHHRTHNTSVKFAPFGRWTPQKRGAPYFGRWASKNLGDFASELI